MQINKNGKWTPRRKRIAIAIYIGIAVLLLIIVVSSKKTPDTNNSTEKAKYAAEVRDYSVVDPSTLRVDLKVHNTSKVSGKPTCTIIADNGNGAYKGRNTYTHEAELKADEWWGFYDNLKISDEGATFVTKVTFECK